MANRFVKDRKDKGTTLKDQNFLKLCEEISPKHLIEFESSSDLSEIQSVIKADAELLSKLNIMDYSLLLLIETRSLSKPIIKTVHSFAG
jgi:hypothetical protein